MPYSMTGFGAAEGPLAGGRIRVEIRTVNHRHFNPSLKLASDLALHETDLRERLRKDFDRGHIAVSVRWTEAAPRSIGLTVDIEKAKVVAAQLRSLQTELGVPGEVDLAMVLRQPDVLAAPSSEESVLPWGDLEPVVAQAIVECKATREREGAVLAKELLHRLKQMERSSEIIAERAPERILRERERLRENIAQLLDGRPVDESRLAQEVAFLADKLDITEELVRFAAHVDAARKALGGDGPVGKQLGFLAQELGREVNTMGSKANDAEIVQQVIAMKGELEKFREQLENLE